MEPMACRAIGCRATDVGAHKMSGTVLPVGGMLYVLLRMLRYLRSERHNVYQVVLQLYFMQTKYATGKLMHAHKDMVKN